MSRDVGIVGGGLLGMVLAHRLTQAGASVTVYERDRRLGGLAGSAVLGGRRVDRYYHVVLPTDDRVLALCEELGLREAIRFRRLGVGFFQDGRLASMSTPRELLAFPGLSPVERARLVAFVAHCRLKRDFVDLETTGVEEWIRRTAGRGLWERVWRPLLDSKFDGRFDDLPATYVWSRMRRTAGTRDRAGREVMGWIPGGYQTVVDELARRIQARGGTIRTRATVQGIASTGGRVTGVVTDAGFQRHGTVVSTVLQPSLETLVQPDVRASLAQDPNRYLGVVCVVARTRQSVSPYYALNITDRSVPLTSVVETTHVVDPEAVGGHLIYVPRYVDPGHPDLDRPADELAKDYLSHVKRMFPAFDPSGDVIAWQVARTRRAEPIHMAGPHRRGMDPFPVPGLATVSSANIYPGIVNGQEIIGVADRVLPGLLASLAHAPEERLAA